MKDPAVEERLAAISKAIKASMLDSVWKPNDDATRRRLAESLQRELDVLPDITGEVSSCVDMWSTMGFSMRCKWVLANKVFSWIGRDVRGYFAAWRACVPDAADVDYDTYPNSWIPAWAVEDPKSILVTTFSMVIPKPLHTINMKFTVNHE